jgi:hypothetical protein
MLSTLVGTSETTRLLSTNNNNNNNNNNNSNNYKKISLINKSNVNDQSFFEWLAG